MSYILRYGNAGKMMCPVIAAEAGLDVFLNSEKLPADAEYCFRWGTTSGINNDKIKVVNKIKSINTTCDKRAFRKACADINISPRTWIDIDAFRKDVGNKEFDVLIRPAEHERSANINCCTNVWDVMDAMKNIRGEFYISEYVKKTQEFRVMVVSGRVVWVIEKMPKDKDAVSWGCVQDGEFEYVGWEEWNANVIDVSLKAMQLSTLDFGAVDVMVDVDGRAYVLEVNTAPYLTPYYAKTVGKAFKWIVEKGRDYFPILAYKDWKDAIHPAISDKARV